MIGGSEHDRYVEYLKAEWSLHGASPLRSAAVRDAVASQSIQRVLDVGAGAGQEMQPLVSGGGVLGVGIDISAWAAPTARSLYRQHFSQARVAFICGSMERLPFQPNVFDVVICRLALPYVDNRSAIEEMARVLKPNGVLLVKIHHPRYYWSQLRKNMRGLDSVAALHTIRILTSGALFSLTGVQWHSRLLGREVCQTRGVFLRCAQQYGLRWQADLEDSNPYTPSLNLKKRPAGGSS